VQSAANGIASPRLMWIVPLCGQPAHWQRHTWEFLALVLASVFLMGT
jgi:hypothetical protein